MESQSKMEPFPTNQTLVIIQRTHSKVSSVVLCCITRVSVHLDYEELRMCLTLVGEMDSVPDALPTF